VLGGLARTGRGDERVPNALEKASSAEGPVVRRAAVRAMAKLGDARAVPRLVPRLDVSDPGVRSESRRDSEPRGDD